MTRLLVLLLGTSGAAAAERPSVFGPLAGKIGERELEGIRAALATERQPRALFASQEPVLPCRWSVDAFLEPANRVGATLLRGSVVRLVCAPDEGRPGCSEWRREGPAERYAALAPSEPERGRGPGSQRPFFVDGDFSDEELTTLVAFIGSKPRAPPGAIPESADPGLPIFRVIRKGEAATVYLSVDGGSGEVATVKRAGQGWKLAALAVFVI